MTDLYLIAHKVRGEPTFDVATKIDCPECTVQGCPECDDAGFWWIIPTSGHRAYPARHWLLADLYGGDYSDYSVVNEFEEHSLDAFNALPDHYPTRTESQRSLTDLLGLTTKPKPPTAPIVRRF